MNIDNREDEPTGIPCIVCGKPICLDCWECHNPDCSQFIECEGGLMAEIKIEELAPLLDRLAFLNGPHGSWQEWQALEQSLTTALERYSLALKWDDSDDEYVVRSVYSECEENP